MDVYLLLMFVAVVVMAFGCEVVVELAIALLLRRSPPSATVDDAPALRP